MYQGGGMPSLILAAASQRLTDAIESISEGFSPHDADDRLVICNSAYVFSSVTRHIFGQGPRPRRKTGGHSREGDC
jgi:hypothetical protein